MRKLLPYLLILAAVVAGYVLIGQPTTETPDYDLGLEASSTPDAPATVDPLEAEALRTRKGERPRRPPPMPVDPRKLPKGTLIVQPIGPDLQPLRDRTLRLYGHPSGQIATKLPVYDEDTGAWTFEKVVAGPMRVTVQGDHVVGREEQVVVQADRETRHELHLEIAGMIQYDVLTYEKTRPKKVRVELFDGAGKAAQGWMQARAARDYTTPQRKTSMELGPEGVIFGLRPGPYRLKVTSLESEEWDEQKVEVRTGETAKVTLEIRY